MKSLHESLLADFDTTLAKGDNFLKMYKKAEKDYNKLLNKPSKLRNEAGSYYSISIKSKELANILAGDKEVYKHYANPPYNLPIDTVKFIFDSTDAFDIFTDRFVQIQVIGKSVTGRNDFALITSIFKYTTRKDKIDNLISGDEETVENAIAVLCNLFKDKYKDLNDLKIEFDKNIKYTERMM